MSKYNRLVALGCSITFGFALDDTSKSYFYKAENPSKFSWPYKLAELMGIENVLNLSNPGCSNRDIWHQGINYETDQNDLVLALWTYHNRGTFFREFDLPVNLGIHKRHHGSKIFSKYLYSEYDRLLETAQCIDHLDYYFSKKSINFKFSSVFSIDMLSQFAWSDFEKDYIYLDYDYIYKQNPKASDRIHPGSQAQDDIAHNFYKEILKE